MCAQLEIACGCVRYRCGHRGRVVPVCTLCICACVYACLCVCEGAVCLGTAVRMHSGDQRRPRECGLNPCGLAAEICAFCFPKYLLTVEQRITGGSFQSVSLCS